MVDGGVARDTDLIFNQISQIEFFLSIVEEGGVEDSADELVGSR